jgi:uracil-DNA glycosylase
MMDVSAIDIDASWKDALTDEFQAQYFTALRQKVREAYRTTTVYPPPQQIFRAFDLCPLPKVRVVILGQDPYHGPQQADGLAFSVPTHTAIPPSLKNIYREIEDDLGRPAKTRGNLTDWATQGVLLLNTTLTVPKHNPGGHRGIGWEQFTDAIITAVNHQKRHCVFMLWGNPARRKAAHIDQNAHCVLEAPHPSPLSAHRGFFGCKHFTAANTYLEAHGTTPIEW